MTISTNPRAITGAVSGKRIRRDRSYTVAQAAELCGTSSFAVGRWVRLGYVPAEKKTFNGGTRVVQHIAGADLADFLKSRAKAAKA